MGRKGGGKGGAAPKGQGKVAKGRPVKGGGPRLPDDMYDEIDTFHRQKDKMSLVVDSEDEEGDGESDADEEEEGVYGLSDEDDDDDEEDDSEDEEKGMIGKREVLRDIAPNALSVCVWGGRG